jgi:uncharacterized Zn finger protein
MAWDRFRAPFRPYVSAAERALQAKREVEALRKKGRTITPVVLQGRKIAQTFWGESWCKNLEAYSDYESRLPRGRTYVRNGSVVHLGIATGKIEALVRGSSLYTVDIEIAALADKRWADVVRRCSGQLTSLIELLQGKLSAAVMAVVTDKDGGLFPSPDEIALRCSCPDWAGLCKHLAAVLYGIGARLDHEPELLFRLRGVDPATLFASKAIAGVTGRRAGRAVLPEGSLSAIFGIEIDEGEIAPKKGKKRKKAR